MHWIVDLFKKRYEPIIHTSEEDLLKRFDEYNKLYFDGELRKIKIKLVHSRDVVGEFIHKMNKGTNTFRKKEIQIAENVDWTESDLKSTLVHEMIHYKLAREGRFGPVVHGKYFKREMRRLNKNYDLNIHVLAPYRLQLTDKKFILKEAISFWMLRPIIWVMERIIK